MSARMKSTNLSDFVRMVRSKAALDASLPWISSVTMAGSVSIGAVVLPNSGPGEPCQERPDEAVALEDGLQRVPGQRIGSPQGLQDAGAARRRGQPWVTSTNRRPPASAMGAGVVICQKESPRGFMGSVIIC